MEDILNQLKLVCDLDKEITLTHWDAMHQCEAPVGKVSKKDLIKRVLESDDTIFVQGIFWDD